MKNLRLILALCCVFSLFWVFQPVLALVGYGDVISDEFDSYSLGNLAGQGDWLSGGTLEPQVVNTNCYYGNCVEYDTSSQNDDDYAYNSTTCYTDLVDSSGSQTAWFRVSQYPTSNRATLLGFNYQSGTSGAHWLWLQTDGSLIASFSQGIVEIKDEVPLDTWFKITFSWGDVGAGCDETHMSASWQYNDETALYSYSCMWANTFNWCYLNTGLWKNVYDSNATAVYEMDDVGLVSDKSGSAIFLTAPVSGSTITDDSTELVGGWQNIDSETWTNIRLAFVDLQINETSNVVNVEIDDDNGNFSIPLSEFNVPNNGGWNLRAIVENAQEYNFDVPNPTYNLIFDIEGWSEPYAFTDFETWYTENVEDYESPSDWAITMTGFLNPIFEKVGQFGERIEEYLDVSDAYYKGFDIGSVFPVINAYVLKINDFFGGFPIVNFFKWGILIMIGLFAVKIILKLLSFIPWVGGGG